MKYLGIHLDQNLKLKTYVVYVHKMFKKLENNKQI